MNEPWGLSGPQFLEWYAGGVIVSVLVTLAVQGLLRRTPPTVTDTPSVSGAGADARYSAPHVYTLAVLAGGERRVVDTAVHALIESGILRASREHQITICGDAPDEPVQRAVFNCFGTHKIATLYSLRERAEGTEAVRRISAMALERGLLLGAGRCRAVRSAILLPLAVLGIGVARLVNGLHLHRPIGFLLVFLVLTTIVLAMMAVKAPRRTWAGETMLQQALERRYSGREQPTVDGGSSTAALVSTAALGVAVLGAAGVADQSLRSALYGSTTASSFSSSTASSCGSTSSCSSSSSCGGSSCGGCGG